MSQLYTTHPHIHSHTDLKFTHPHINSHTDLNFTWYWNDPDLQNLIKVKFKFFNENSSFKKDFEQIERNN